MRYAVFGDIHGNLEALQAVLRALRAEGVDRYLCVGDLIGYGADPRECIAVVRALGGLVVAGNHDLAAAGLLDMQEFNPVAREALLWTQSVLTSEDVTYLRELPLVARTDAITLFHAALPQPELFEYIDTPQKAALTFSVLRTRFGFFGHSHVPVVFLGRPEAVLLDLEELPPLPATGTVVANPGSVGQPRDGDPRAAFLLLDLEERRLLLRRVRYPVERAQAKIRRAGLPPVLAQRLALGY